MLDYAKEVWLYNEKHEDGQVAGPDGTVYEISNHLVRVPAGPFASGLMAIPLHRQDFAGRYVVPEHFYRLATPAEVEAHLAGMRLPLGSSTLSEAEGLRAHIAALEARMVVVLNALADKIDPTQPPDQLPALPELTQAPTAPVYAEGAAAPVGPTPQGADAAPDGDAPADAAPAAASAPSGKAKN